MCSNIPASPAYGVYISQLIRFARASSNYSDFLKRHLYLRNRLLDQNFSTELTSPLSSDLRYKSKNDADEAVSVVSFISSSGGYINRRNSANLGLLIDKTSSIYLYDISQLIRFARASSNYSDFLKRHLYLRNRLLDQSYKKIRLIRFLKKFIFRYQDNL
jgi:uncharacterized protein with von Willebrand factor type A (vWA) domain